MAWRYQCNDCDTHTTWMGRADAESSRYRHHDTHHAGRAPARERFVSNAERVSLSRTALFLGALLALSAFSWISDKLG
jgi:hypothetical protein